jgi:hypothetical protein
MTLSEEARLWRPGARTIKEPIPVATRPTGELYRLPLWLPTGARHPLIGGATGSGKSVLINDLMAGMVPCYDVVIWYIEIAKEGQGAAPWAQCVDWLATDAVEAIKMLRAMRRINKARMRQLAVQAAKGKGGDKVTPSRRQPLIVLIIDEANALFACLSSNEEAMALAMDAADEAGKVASEVRAAAESLVIATQRPTVESLGGNGTLHSQLFPSLCLRMNKRRDTQFVLRDIDLDQIDASQLTANGAMYIQDTVGDEPLPLRTLTLFEPAHIFALASLYGPHLQGLRDSADIDAAGADYARRTIPTEMFSDPDDDAPAPARDVVTAGGSTAPSSPAPKPNSPASEPARAAFPQANGGPASTADFAAAATARKNVAAVLADMRAMVEAGDQLDPLPAIPVDQLADDHQAECAPPQPGDAESIEALLTVLAACPPEGMTVGDIVRETLRTERQVPRSTAYRLLAQLCREDPPRAVRSRVPGTKAKRYRYHAAELQDTAA